MGLTVDQGMAAIERDNPAIRNVLPRDYARPALDKRRLGQLIDMISNIQVGDEDARSRDVLGRVYEYFLSQFYLNSQARRARRAESSTRRGALSRCWSRCWNLIGDGSMTPVAAHPACSSSLSHSSAPTQQQWEPRESYGRHKYLWPESNYTTWRLAKMNLAIRGIEGQIAHGDSFHNDRHPDLKADFILANPPFNVSDWGGAQLADDKRWRYGVPPKGNANFAWVQHMVHHLAPSGVAGIVLANGSMSSSQSGEGEIRKNLSRRTWLTVWSRCRAALLLDADSGLPVVLGSPPPTNW